MGIKEFLKARVFGVLCAIQSRAFNTGFFKLADRVRWRNKFSHACKGDKINLLSHRMA
jgi:hypothetical protein